MNWMTLTSEPPLASDDVSRRHLPPTGTHTAHHIEGAPHTVVHQSAVMQCKAWIVSLESFVLKRG